MNGVCSECSKGDILMLPLNRTLQDRMGSENPEKLEEHQKKKMAEVDKVWNELKWLAKEQVGMTEVFRLCSAEKQGGKRSTVKCVDGC